MSKLQSGLSVIKQWSLLLVALLGSALTQPAYADYSANPQARELVDALVQNQGFDRAELTGLLRQAQRQDKILEAIARPAEKTLAWKDYRKIFLIPQRIDGGRQFMREHADALKRAQETYGVPAQIITAIIGVETLYGRHKGGYRVLDALATLAFDYPPRAPFFLSELQQFLLLAREQGIDPLQVRGSYAGAMGFGQFISSSYRKYAVDFDGDGHIDIIGDPVDAIGSVANYFKAFGWQSGQPVAVTVPTPSAAGQTLVQSDLQLNHSLADMQAAGIQYQLPLAPQAPALLLQLDGAQGAEYWLALNNFYVITRYNNSPLYAMAVYQLSQEVLND